MAFPDIVLRLCARYSTVQSGATSRGSPRRLLCELTAQAHCPVRFSIL